MIVPATQANIEKAAAILRKGGIVAFPTETVYGLGADATNPKAALRIFALKKRPAFDPLIVHAETAAAARRLWSVDSPLARKLAGLFWPGPLTIVLPKSKHVPDVVTAGLDTVAVRVPSHPVARRLIRAAGVPIAAPSANLFGRTSPTTARAVEEDLGHGVDMILDAGPCPVGVESTVVRPEGRRLVILRPGGVTREALAKAAPAALARGRAAKGKALRSPGLLTSHYAPRTPLHLASGTAAALAASLALRRARALRAGRAWPRIGLLSFRPLRTASGTFAAERSLTRRGDAREAAAVLFQHLRELDRMELDFLVAERLPAKGLGLAVLDRLERASAGTPGLNRLLQR